MGALKRYLLPGFVFQSVVIAGGYGTGREIAEFFLAHGPVGGLMAMAISTLVISLVCSASYEFARKFGAFDYRVFFQRLLGKGWPLFEALYLAQLLLVLAVVGAAGGAMFQSLAGASYAVGVGLIMVMVAALVFGGNEVIERVLSGWSGILYVVYFAFFALCASRFSQEIHAQFLTHPPVGNWVLSGFRYAGYNLAVLVAVLISIRHHKTKRDTLVSGMLTGPIAMIPALLFFVAISGEYPAIAAADVPLNHMLDLLGKDWFRVVFQITLIGTLTETGAGMIHAVNQRAESALRERGKSLRRGLRAVFAAVLLAGSAGLAQLGLTELIAKGYGYITYGFLAVFVLPILTWGVYLMRSRGELER